MRKIEAGLVSMAEKYVMALLESKLSEGYLFHSKKHTLDVLRNSLIIGQKSGLAEDEMYVLRISALFHDVGYIRDNENHEAESTRIAAEFLRSSQVGEEDIELVSLAILATKVPQQPGNRISEVLCDADLMHLTGDDYFGQMELLRLEWQSTGKQVFTEREFHLNSIDFFARHHYHSEYGRNVLEGKKEETLARIRERVRSLSAG